MLVIPTSSNIDSWIYADYSTNGQQLVGGISQPCGIGFPEDALSDLYVPSTCSPVRTEACDLHAIRYILLQVLWQKLGGEVTLYQQCSPVFCCSPVPETLLL